MSAERNDELAEMVTRKRIPWNQMSTVEITAILDSAGSAGDMELVRNGRRALDRRINRVADRMLARRGLTPSAQ